MHLSAIWRYPVKSCQGTQLDSATLDAFGIEGDRLFAIIADDGRVLSQKVFPRLNLMGVDLQAHWLRLSFPGNPDLLVDTTGCGTDMIVDMHGEMPGECLGDTAAEWLTSALGRRCRLIRSNVSFSRQVHPAAAHLFLPLQERYPDAGPIHIISQSSLDDLSHRAGTELAPSRFRPNLVVATTNPYTEDLWRQIRIGDIPFACMGPCERCGVTLLKPNSVERGQEPLRTLRGYRTMPAGLAGGIAFGSFFRPLAEGIVRQGDPVEVIEVGEPISFEEV